MSESRILDRFMRSAGQIIRLFNPKSLEFEVQRTPTVFKSVNTATTATLWTCPSDKRIRLLGMEIIGRGFAKVAAGDCTITIAGSSSTATFLTHCYLVAAANATAGFSGVRLNLPTNGVLFAQGENIVATFGADLTVGGICFNLWGCEE